jgi:hypothetical protein
LNPEKIDLPDPDLYYFKEDSKKFDTKFFQWPQKCQGRIQIRVRQDPRKISLPDPNPYFRITDPQEIFTDPEH